MSAATEKNANLRASIMGEFMFLLNAMEFAAQQEHPSRHGHGDKRRAVMQYVESLALDIYPEVAK